jgi:hypothetical protein
MVKPGGQFYLRKFGIGGRCGPFGSEGQHQWAEHQRQEEEARTHRIRSIEGE